jgi:nucleoid-associated protein EbfC
VELDLRKLMEQAQQLSRNLEGRRAELSRREIEGQAGAGLVTAVMSGTGQLLRLHIDPKTFQSDQALVEDLIVAAVNSALAEVRALQQRELTGFVPGAAFVVPPQGPLGDPSGNSGENT